MKRVATFALCAAALAPLPLIAHPGGLDANGCHRDRKAGGRHCHRATQAPARAMTAVDAPGGAFRNCSAARTAGAAPVRRGDPGYGTHLDRDGDGVGCE